MESEVTLQTRTEELLREIGVQVGLDVTSYITTFTEQLYACVEDLLEDTEWHAFNSARFTYPVPTKILAKLKKRIATYPARREDRTMSEAGDSGDTITSNGSLDDTYNTSLSSGSFNTQGPSVSLGRQSNNSIADSLGNASNNDAGESNSSIEVIRRGSARPSILTSPYSSASPPPIPIKRKIIPTVAPPCSSSMSHPTSPPPRASESLSRPASVLPRRSSHSNGEGFGRLHVEGQSLLQVQLIASSKKNQIRSGSGDLDLIKNCGWSDASSEKSCARKESSDSCQDGMRTKAGRRESYDSSGDGGKLNTQLRSESCDSDRQNIKPFRSCSFDSTDDGKSERVKKPLRSGSCDGVEEVIVTKNMNRRASQEGKLGFRAHEQGESRNERKNSIHSSSFDSVDEAGTKNEPKKHLFRGAESPETRDPSRGKLVGRRESFDGEEDLVGRNSESRRRIAHPSAHTSSGASSGNSNGRGSSSSSHSSSGNSGSCAGARNRESRHHHGGFGRVAQSSHFASKVSGMDGPFVDPRSHQTSVSLLRMLENPEVYPSTPIPPHALRDCYERENLAYQDQLSSQVARMMRDKERERQFRASSTKQELPRSPPRSNRRRSKDSSSSSNNYNHHRPPASPFRALPIYLSDEDERGPRLGSPEFCPLPPLSPIDNFRCGPSGHSSSSSVFPLVCSPTPSSSSTTTICPASDTTPRTLSPSRPLSSSPLCLSPTGAVMAGSTGFTPASSLSPRSNCFSSSASSSISLHSPPAYSAVCLPPPYSVSTTALTTSQAPIITTISPQLASRSMHSPASSHSLVLAHPPVSSRANSPLGPSPLVAFANHSVSPIPSNPGSPTLLRVHLSVQEKLNDKVVSPTVFPPSGGLNPSVSILPSSCSPNACSSSSSSSSSSPSVFVFTAITPASSSGVPSPSLPHDPQHPNTPDKPISQPSAISPTRVLDFLLASNPPTPPPLPPPSPILLSPDLIPSPVLTPMCPHLQPPASPVMPSPPSSPDFSISRQRESTVRLSPPASPSYMGTIVTQYSPFAERNYSSVAHASRGGGGGGGDKGRGGSSSNQFRVPRGGGRGSGGRNSEWKGGGRPPLWVPFRVPQQKMPEKPPKYPAPSHHHNNSSNGWQHATSVSASRLMSRESLDVHSSEILEEDLADPTSSMCSLDSDEDYILAQKSNDLGPMYKPPGSPFASPLDVWRENFRQKRVESSPRLRETSRSSVSSEGSSLSTSSIASPGYRNHSLSSLDSWQMNFERSRQNHYVPSEMEKESSDTFASGPPVQAKLPTSRGLMPSLTSVIYYSHDRAAIGGNAQHMILFYAPRSRTLPPGPGCLHWYPPGGTLSSSQFIALSDIVDVYVGKRTEVMGLPVASKAVSKRCFSIVSKDGRSVNFETGAASVRAAWVYGIHRVLTAFGQRTASLDDEQVPPTAIGPSPNSSVSTSSTPSTSEFLARPSLVHVSPPSTLSNPSGSPSSLRAAWASSPEPFSPLPPDCFVLQVSPSQPEVPVTPPSPLASSPSRFVPPPDTSGASSSSPPLPSQSSPPTRCSTTTTATVPKTLSPQRPLDTFSLSRVKVPPPSSGHFLARPKSPGLTKPLSLSLEKCSPIAASSATSPRATSPRSVGPSAFQFYSPASTMTPLGTPSLRMHPRGRPGHVRIERARPSTAPKPQPSETTAVASV